MITVILCTVPTDEVQKLVRPLVEEKLVACINVASVDSFYIWEGKMEEEKESLLIMKTRSDKVEEIISRIRELHSYEVPEIIALPVTDGFEGYLDWVKNSVE